MAEDFWQRCPECKVAQYWAPPGHYPQKCATCGGVPGVDWEKEMASKFSVEPSVSPPPPLRAVPANPRHALKPKSPPPSLATEPNGEIPLRA